jgi:hypothetical protein
MADAICPTFAAGCLSMVTRVLDDCATSYNVTNSVTKNLVINPYFNNVGSQNNDPCNAVLSKTVTPTYSTLSAFGTTGLQS